MHYKVETVNNLKKVCEKANLRLEMSVLRKNIHKAAKLMLPFRVTPEVSPRNGNTKGHLLSNRLISSYSPVWIKPHIFPPASGTYLWETGPQKMSVLESSDLAKTRWERQHSRQLGFIRKVLLWIYDEHLIGHNPLCPSATSCSLNLIQ